MKDGLARSKAYRARMKSLGLCITSERHGPATHGVLCEKCRTIHLGRAPNPIVMPEDEVSC